MTDAACETIFYILGACDTLAKQEYFTCHNNIFQYVHFIILQHYKLDTGENWFKQKPAEVQTEH